jgi:hypothetical protein
MAAGRVRWARWAIAAAAVGLLVLQQLLMPYSVPAVHYELRSVPVQQAAAADAGSDGAQAAAAGTREAGLGPGDTGADTGHERARAELAAVSDAPGSAAAEAQAAAPDGADAAAAAAAAAAVAGAAQRAASQTEKAPAAQPGAARVGGDLYDEGVLLREALAVARPGLNG